MTQQVRLGIIGYGSQGGLYAGLLAQGRVADTVLGAIVDTDPERRALAAAEHPDAPVLDSLDALLTAGLVDAIVTTVPHFLHPEMGIAALRAGLHVMVEKPAGVYTAQVEELNTCAAQHPDLVFAIMFNQRVNPLYQRLKAIVDGGEIGEIRRSTWIMTSWWRPQGYYDQSEWRATWGGEGGGVLVNQAPHQLDLWQWICGRPRTVTAKVAEGFRREIAVENEVTVLADYGDGVTGVFITGTHDLVGTDRLEILGDRGKIVVDDSRRATITRLVRPEEQISAELPTEQMRGIFRGETDVSDLYEVEEIEHVSRFGDQHAVVLANFARAVLDGEPLVAPGSDGIHGVRLANAVHLSGWTGREVPLDHDPAEFLAELDDRIRREGLFPTRT
ncbi:Gfo/Idh/MocA family protein [Litorihabitans aurantiacus]|uniref:Dehydrogenase n=1 Tax=Litorihabitans aurantiacus TaxID=1930061 RepID=A0AA37XG79_9MICO|nr:Gfo/Idh/MocA family oxidoreductase [Litorihabitans aurantiacus]GMA32554.1 dehydrogenase [Litorihabitans aurantiacus]